MILSMHVVFAQILGLGKPPSAFGITLAMILTWVVCLGGLTTAVIICIKGQAKAERKEDLYRAAKFDAEHRKPTA